MPLPERSPPSTLRAARPTGREADGVRRSRRALVGMIVTTAAAYAWSAVDPHDRTTWWLETLPVIAIAAALWVTRRPFPLTPLLYGLTAAGLVMLCVGAHYTFERVPAGEWAQSALGLERNHYDRLGHALQGLVPAIALREVLIRRSPLATSRWLTPLVLAVCLAISAGYELVEWGMALLIGARAESFLGTQGDRWDPQWDMLCALAGAVLALATLARAHDRALARLRGATRADGGVVPAVAHGGAA